MEDWTREVFWPESYASLDYAVDRKLAQRDGNPVSGPYLGIFINTRILSYNKHWFTVKFPLTHSIISHPAF